jgi:hypothetical protein
MKGKAMVSVSYEFNRMFTLFKRKDGALKIRGFKYILLL